MKSNEDTCTQCKSIVNTNSNGSYSCISCGHDEPSVATNDAGEKQQSVKATLKERGARYGEFKNHAKLSQELKNTFLGHVRDHGHPKLFTDEMIEAIEMILHKLARIANGSPQYIDNFVDICGYSQLVVDSLTKSQNVEK